jgi:hypothetical protein
MFTLTSLWLLVIINLILSGLLFWGFSRVRHHRISNSWIGNQNDLSMWLLVLAAFVMGIFLTYVLFAWPLQG